MFVLSVLFKLVLSIFSFMSSALEEFNNGNYTKCIEWCSKEIQENKIFALQARNIRGTLYMLKCQYKDAQDDFDFVLNDETASNRLKANTYIKLTALNLQKNQEQEAFSNYEKAIEIDVDNEDIYCNRAQVFAIKGRFEDCLKDFDRCLEIKPDHKVAQIQKAFFEFRKFYAEQVQLAQSMGVDLRAIAGNRLAEETKKLEKLILENADIPEAFNLFAQILSEQEEYEKADKFYKNALEKDPKNAALMVQHALSIMSWRNDFEEPIKILNEAIKIDETCEFAYETLATIEIQR